MLSLWEKSMSSIWNHDPVWIHGNLRDKHILIENSQLSAVKNFGWVAIGDPAYDLIIAWTFFDDENRKIFKKYIGLDENTWARACGWALWNALVTLIKINDKNSLRAKQQMQVISNIISEHELNL